ncbi:Scytalone dehydratase [Penicillium macrosclerotiorum]|uniref:Scytalone dehydratase n=1 Tax=Penicillium macrosclerotiorum TaxID=303699 RepID=UPI0025496BFC|nr:Scytalone dehydratase [Penicillium macrosclerotiorum]KAJ5690267.1 Scytalone dehydratase [Penicillium macrosclerotiorum]
MKSEDFITLMSSPHFLGDPLVRTQHLLGAAKYEYVSEYEIVATHQVRAAHQRYVDLEHTKVAYQGYGNGSVKHWYKKIDGVWKLSGILPEMYWTEGDFSKIFVNPSVA